jgi:N-acetylmuramoyl-L-alanine amidase/FG-GAP-like repeat
VAVKLVLALVVAAAGVLAPVPRWRGEQAMATETRRPLAEGAAVQPVDPPAGGGRVVITDDTRDFDLIGVTLPEAPTDAVLVRTAAADGVWGPWQPLEFEDEVPAPAVPGEPVPQEPDEEAPGAHSDPLWVGDATRYELELPGRLADVAQVHLVYETTRDVAIAETAPAGADPATPSIAPRSSWGARPPKVTPTIASRLQLGVVHHTVGTNNYGPGDVPAILRGVQAYHMDANGWNDIAYNFAVDRFGRVWEARAGGVKNAVVGGHARGFNTGSTGVAVLGNHETVGPSAATVEAVAYLLAWKFAIHDVDVRTPVAYRAGEGSPRYAPGSVVTLNRIVGHRDVGLTACPGQYLYAHVGAIRGRAGVLYRSMGAPGSLLAGNFAGGHATDVYLRQPGVWADRMALTTVDGLSERWLFPVDGSFRPFAGDFDANGYDDIFWYAPGTARDSAWLSRGDGTFRLVAVPPVSGQYIPVVGDVDGDRDGDVYWYAPGSTADRLWVAQRGSFGTASAPQVNGTYRPVAGDYDGDGDDDVVWSAPGTATDYLWVASNGRFSPRVGPAVSGTYRPVAGDYDGDGDDDVLWYAPGSRAEYIWTTRDLRFSSRQAPSVDAVFQSVASGDFDGDRADDIVWYASPGDDWVWWHTSVMLGRSSRTDIPLR